MAYNSIKAGARHSASDMADLQGIHDLSVKQGATCGLAAKKTAPLIASGGAIKSAGGGKIEGFLVRFGGQGDLSQWRDVFDAQTDYGVKDGDELVTLWHHNLDPEVTGPIGKGVLKKMDAGWWFQSWLNRRDDYEAAILRLVELGKAGWSSGADPSKVVREPLGKGMHRLRVWNIIEGSVTPIPADPGNIVSIKSLMAGGSRAAYTDRAIDLELDLDRLEDEVRAAALLADLDRLAESPGARKSRLLGELDRLGGAKPALLVPGPGSGEVIDPNDRWGIR
jgi:hypothetical protein